MVCQMQNPDCRRRCMVDFAKIMKIWVFRAFVGLPNSSPIGDFALRCFGPEPLGVASRTFLGRTVHKYLKYILCQDLVGKRAMRLHRRNQRADDGDSLTIQDFCRFGHSANVFGSIGEAEA